MINKTNMENSTISTNNIIILEDYKTLLKVQKMADCYELSFQCSIDCELNNEVILSFSKNDPMYKEYLAKIFQHESRFSILDKNQFIELDIGYAEEQEYYLYFALVDYQLEPLEHPYDAALNYKIVIDSTHKYYEQFQLLMEMIVKNREKKVSDGDEYKSNTTKHKRTSRF